MVDSASVDVAWILTFASDLLNHTSTNVYTNPIDVATVIDLLGIIVKLQAKSISVDVQTSEKNLKEFKKATIESPTQEDMQKFIQVNYRILVFSYKLICIQFIILKSILSLDLFRFS